MARLVRWEQARQVVRLVSESHEMGRGTPEGWGHILNGMCQILGARYGALAEMGEVPASGHAKVGLSVLSASYAGDSDAHRVVRALISREAANPAASEVLRRVGSELVVAARRRDLVTDGAWYRSLFVNEYVLPAHQDDSLFGACVDGQGRSTGLAFVKARGDTPFSEEDRDVLDLLMSGCAAGIARKPQPKRLAPRVQATLELLLAGHADKDIAAHLAISHYTVRDYVKQIFRTYGVTSRTQLLALHRR